MNVSSRDVLVIFLASVLLFSTGFGLGRKTAPPSPSVAVTVERVAGQDDVTLSRAGDWIQVHRDGRLSAEWQPRDGAVWAVLDLVLRDEWSLLSERYPVPVVEERDV
jgi:hypothetical protein